MPNGGSCLMAPIMALRMVDIHNSAARLAPKPMLPNAANATRMAMRSEKRTSTWVELSCRVWGSCAMTGNSGETDRGSAEIIAADHVERVGAARHRGNAGPARRRAEALDIDERAQDRQRQICVAGFDRAVEPVGQLALARQRAVPLAIVIGDAANLPHRQFEVDQRQRRIGPGARSDQPLDPRGLVDLS